MKYTSILISSLLLLAACSPSHQPVPAENATDAGREFVRAVLDGDFEKANYYLLPDSTNQLLLKQQQTNFSELKEDVRRNYKEASIRPVGIEKVNDSTTIFKYYHTANTKDTTPLRIIRKDGQWLVDLKSVIKM